MGSRCCELGSYSGLLLGGVNGVDGRWCIGGQHAWSIWNGEAGQAIDIVWILFMEFEQEHGRINNDNTKNSTGTFLAAMFQNLVVFQP
jgi:hypothetical protein